MKADTRTKGARLLVEHGRGAVKGSTCTGGTATVEAVSAHGFVARCACGWRFGGMHTDGYNAPEESNGDAHATQIIERAPTQWLRNLLGYMEDIAAGTHLPVWKHELYGAHARVVSSAPSGADLLRKALASR